MVVKRMISRFLKIESGRFFNSSEARIMVTKSEERGKSEVDSIVCAIRDRINHSSAKKLARTKCV